MISNNRVTLLKTRGIPCCYNPYFTAIVDLFLYQKIIAVDMNASLKAVE